MSDTGQGGGHTEGRPQMVRAVVLVVVVVVVAVLVLRHTGSSSSAHTAAGPASTTTTTGNGPASTTTTTLPPIAPDATTVQVLNGLQSGTLAGNLTTKLAADGYKTLVANNTTVATTRSIVYVLDTSYRSAGFALAGRLGLPSADVYARVPATAPFPAGVKSDADLVVIIGSSLQQLASTS